MKNRTLKPLVESGILAAAAVVLALISFFIPVLGSFTVAVIPLPIIVLIMRHGVRWGIMATAVTVMLVGLFAGPLSAINIMALCGLLGITLGYAYRRRFAAVKSIALGAVAGIGALLVSIGVSFAAVGMNPIQLETELMNKTIEQALMLESEAGISEDELREMRTMLEEGVSMAVRMLPAAFVLAEIILAYINYLVAGMVLRRLGENQLPQLPPIREWRMPGIVVYVFLLSLVGQYWGVTRELETLHTAALNLNLLSLFFGFLQGLALLFCLAQRYQISGFIRGLILLMILLTGMFQIIGILGLVDIAINYRRRLNQ